MLKFKLQFQSRSGLTLVELVLGLAIMCMLMATLYTCLGFTLLVSKKSIEEDEILLNGRYILEYIKEDIGSADKIITSSSFPGLDRKYPTNIGFVILKFDKTRDKTTGKLMDAVSYNYTTYYIKNNSIVRINAKQLIHKDFMTDTEILKSRLPKEDDFRGYNVIGYDLSRESKIFLNERNVISLDLFFENNSYKTINFKCDILVRCQVVK